MYSCYLQLLLLIIFAILCLESTTIKNYCTLSEFHTMCIYSEDYFSKHCFIKPNNSMTHEDRKFIVNLHNGIRRKLALGQRITGIQWKNKKIGFMMKLSWDIELEEIARRWAQQCVPTRDQYRNVERWKVGQNVYINKNGNSNWKNPIKNFLEYFRSARLKEKTYDIYNKFIIMTWSRAYAIGCARVTFNVTVTIFVCNYAPYDPSGTDDVFKYSEPCSQCPVKTYCQRGLCVNSNKSMTSAEYNENFSSKLYKLF